MTICDTCLHKGICEYYVDGYVLNFNKCSDFINEKEHEFYNQFMKIWKESDFPEELEMYTSDLLIQLGINEDIDDDDQ